MKHVYICGDSFSTPDPDYGPSWVDMLTTKLSGHARIHNDSSVAASNLLISVQVQQAIDHPADFVIMQGTAVTRDQVNVGPDSKLSLMERFRQRHLVSFSVYRPYRSFLDPQQQTAIKDFYTRFFDLDLYIYRDQCIIENSLQRLTDSGIPFLFDQGGFEHASFGGERKNYFEKFKQNFSAVNLWDYGNTAEERPYYHIKDHAIHEEVAEYYYTQIEPYL